MEHITDMMWSGFLIGLGIVIFREVFIYAKAHDDAAKARKEQESSTDKSQ